MPLQNRVDPYGTIFRTQARGTMMGNRGGALHNDQREIVRPFLNQRWITCVLEFRGRHRSVMSPGRYTELFFLDEAVAFAAGHRPCAECRRERFNAFRFAWKGTPSAPPSAPDIDAKLHRSRVDTRRQKVTYEAALSSLPNGTFIEIDRHPCLVWDDAIFPWTPEGYADRKPRPNRSRVTVLTPQPIVHCFRHGYEPEIHASSRYNNSRGEIATP
jgi:hypothetical protein